jgi:LysR family transcriptional regulator, hydrogen peroxide-inducible genes activator
MELQQLRYVLAVAETGNFTRASEKSNVAQPSLSQQIIKLEKELGHKLFHRLGRKAVTTEAGAVFVERAKRVLQELDDASRELKDGYALERSITIGSVPTLAPSLLPPLLAMCQSRFPQLTVNVVEDFRDELLRGVISGELDLALVALPVKDPHVHVELLTSEPLQLVLGKNHPLASKLKITVEDIRNERFIMLGGGSTLLLEIQRFFGDNQLEPTISCRCAQISTVKALVNLGKGIAILPKVALNMEDRSSLIIRSLEGRNPTREIGVVRHLQRFQSKGSEQFLGLLREHLKKPTLANSGR